MIQGKVTVRSTVPPPAQMSAALRDTVRVEMEALAESLVGRIKQNVNAMGITTTGARGLVGSWQVSSGTQSGKDITVRVRSPLPYAAYVEFGTAGAREKARRWPPLEPLLAWVALKLRYQSVERKTKTGIIVTRKRQRWGAGMIKPRTPTEQDEILRIARAVQRKIYWWGTKPRWYMREALASLQLEATAEPDKATESMVYRINIMKWLASRPFWDEAARRAKTR